MISAEGSVTKAHVFKGVKVIESEVVFAARSEDGGFGIESKESQFESCLLVGPFRF